MIQNTEKSKDKILEIDVPPSSHPNDTNGEHSLKIFEEPITEDMANKLEQHAKYADRMERHIYKRHAYQLLIGCLIAYGLLVIMDTIIPNFNIEASKMSEGFVELLKFIVSTLIGFVFSENLKNDKTK